MEPTASDPEVVQQFGMIAGKANAGQLNALGQSKMALIAKAAPSRGNGPVTVYVGGADDKAAQPRITP